MDKKEINKLAWTVGIIVLLIIIFSVVDRDDKKSIPKTPQTQISQEQQEKQTSDAPEKKINIEQKQQVKVQPIPDKIETLSDFENSQFCKDLKCNKDDSWRLNSGGINHSYDIPLGGDKYNYLSVGVVVDNKKVIHLGLMYFDRETSMLSLSDLKIAYNFLNSIDSTLSIDSLKNYITQNINKEIFQINQAPPILWGSFKVYVGKIGQQTISVERIK